MATETVVPMDDKELFAAAVAEEPTQEAAQTETPAEAEATTEQPRDEQGRFTSKTDTAPQADAAPTQQQPEAVTEQPKDDATGNVPSWRLRELREERDALRRQAEETSRQSYAMQQQFAELQRRLAEFQKPKQEPVDFFADPNAAFKQQMSPMEERLAQLEGNMRFANSRALAVARHGWEAVQEVEKAVAEATRNNDPSLQSLTAQLRVTDDPVGAAMQWHSNQSLMKETGGNLAAYRDKILADALKDPTYQAKVIEAARGQPQGSRPNIQLPPSLNKTAGSGVTASELASEDMSDAGLFKYATARGR